MAGVGRALVPTAERRVHASAATRVRGGRAPTERRLRVPAPPPAYAAPTAAGYGPPTGTRPKTNGLAIASLSCSIGGVVGGFLTCGLLAPAVVVGIVLGHVSLSQIKQDPTQEGRGMALGGVITGWVVVGLGMLTIIVLMIASAGSTT